MNTCLNNKPYTPASNGAPNTEYSRVMNNLNATETYFTNNSLTTEVQQLGNILQWTDEKTF
jgi:hypothetical protein